MSTTCPSLQFKEHGPDSLEADAPFWQLYEESFRPWLREPRSVITDSLRQGVGIAIAASDQEETVGLATFHLLEDPPALFLVYLAVTPKLRGQRLGGELLERSLDVAMARQRERGIEPLGAIWEVDDPDRATTEVQRVRRHRRIGFFQRHGGILLDTAYSQPPLIEGTAALPMRLLFRPATGQMPDDAQISRMIRGIYLEKYGQVNGLDAGLLESLLAGLPT